MSLRAIEPWAGLITGRGICLALIEKHNLSRKVVFALASPLGRLHNNRVARFGSVAVTCTLFQEVVLHVLIHYGQGHAVANALSFIISAQLNFALSAIFTWRDRQLDWSLRATASRWCTFNAAAMVALVLNEVVFVSLDGIGLWAAMSMLLAAGAGAVVAFTVNNFLTFGRRPATPIETEQRPALRRIRKYTWSRGVAFFLPAYNEARNLEKVVPAIVQYFRRMKCEFTVIIVNDGSTKDDTRVVANTLADIYDGEVIAVHHEANQGYGAALQTGIKAALRTDHDLIGFCDADGQFEIESFSTLLAALIENNADYSVGYRIERADSLKRRLMGRGWHWLSSLVLGFEVARDVDCGFKLFTRSMLSHVAPQLCGDHAVISPEILVRAHKAGFRIAEAGVTHRSRDHGVQTGANIKVVINSLIQLWELRESMSKGGENVVAAQLAPASAGK